MSAREQGRRIIKEVEDYEAKFDLGQRLGDTGRVGIGGDDAERGAGIGAAADFPARYLYPDERDKKYAIRRQLNAQANRPDPITDDEIDWLLDKTTGYETAEFHKWFSRLYKMDDSNPVMKKWGMELVPELWSMKEQVIENNARLQTQLAKIKLRGVRSKEDLMLMYAIAKGAIAVPQGPIYSPSALPDFAESRRGVFNPRHLAGRPANWFQTDKRGASGFISTPAGSGLGALDRPGAPPFNEDPYDNARNLGFRVGGEGGAGVNFAAIAQQLN